MIIEIQNWLANPNRDYTTGLKIYNEYKKDKKFDAFFDQVTEPDAGSMHFKMLVQQLQQIHRKLTLNPSLIKQPAIGVKPIDTDELKKKYREHAGGNEAKRPHVVDNPLVNAKELPEHLQKLYFENKDLSRQITVKKAELNAIPNETEHNQKRKEVANELCAMDDHRAANWKAIDAWWKGNKVKPEEKTAFDERKEILNIARRVENLKIYIGREEKALASKDPMPASHADKIKKRLDGFKKELAELEPKLK